MKTVVKDFCYRSEHFSIVYDDKYYMTVNHKFIGDDGRLTKALNFWDGLHPSDSVSDCIDTTKKDLDMKYYESTGMSKAEAFSKVYNMPLDITKQLFGEE